jgi:hypothetical protein
MRGEHVDQGGRSPACGSTSVNHDPLPGRRSIRASAVIYTALGLSFGVSTPIVLAHLGRTGSLPLMFGFRALAGPFESLGRPTFTALGSLLVAACGLDVAVGALLWRGRREGARLAVVATPISLALAIGFALPLFLIGLPMAALLLVLGRSSLKS